MADQDRTYGTVAIEVRERRRLQTPRRRPRRIRRRMCACIAISLLLVVLLLAYFFFVLIPNLFTCCSAFNPLCAPWTTLLGPRTPSHHDTTGELYAVGFSLAAGYGTAAISFRNGTSMTVGRHDGDDVYRMFMAKVSSNNAAHPSPPYYCRGAHSDSQRQWNRYWRKRSGKPASKEIGALAKVLMGLKDPINEALGDLGPFKYGTIAVPYLPAIYNEDLVDAAEYAGFQLITPFKLSGDAEEQPISDINFSFCGMRLGSCRNFTNDTVDAGYNVSEKREGDTLSISFTMDMLTAHVTPMCGSAQYFYAAFGIADPWLGRGAIDVYASSDQYWAAVGAALVDALDSYSWRARELELVIVHGESATDPDFQHVLREKVTTYQTTKEMPTVVMKEPLYAAALGAAELGKRCMLTDGAAYFGGCIPDLRPKSQGW